MQLNGHSTHLPIISQVPAAGRLLRGRAAEDKRRERQHTGEPAAVLRPIRRQEVVRGGRKVGRAARPHQEGEVAAVAPGVPRPRQEPGLLLLQELRQQEEQEIFIRLFHLFF